MKTADYFPIDANHCNKPEMAELIMNHYYSGYGLYMTLLQRLLSTPTRTIEHTKVKALAFDLHTTVTDLQPIIDNYFQKDDKVFWSVELNEKMVYYDEKYNKASEGGKKAAANMTPEQRKERATKASDAALKKRLEQEAEEQAQAENFEIDKNNNSYKSDLSSKVTDVSDLGDSKDNDLTPLDASPNNRIELNRIEQKRTELNRTEENRTEKNQKEEPVPGFSSDLVSDNLDVTTDLFFDNVETISNVQKIFNDFCEVCKEANKMSILQFEKILIYQYFNSTKSYYEKKGLNNEMNKELLVDFINSYNKTKPNIVLDELDNLIKRVKADSNVKADFDLTVPKYYIIQVNQVDQAS